MLAAAVSAAAMLALAAPAVGATGYASCATAAKLGDSVNAKNDPKNAIAAAYGVSAVEPEHDVTFSSFAFLYKTRGAAWFLQDSLGRQIVPVDGNDERAIRKGYTILTEQSPPPVLSAGAQVFLAKHWDLTVLPCKP